MGLSPEILIARIITKEAKNKRLLVIKN